MKKIKQRVRIFFKKAKRTEAEIEEHVWEIEDESPVGFRTIKTALSIFCCLLLYHILEPHGFVGTSDAFLACVTAIICMKDSVNESFKIGIFRLVGTLIGALSGLLYLYLDIFLENPYWDILLISLFIILIITICNIVKSPQAIVICCVVFLVISLEQVSTDPAVHSAKRFCDTAVGLTISFLINRFLFNPDKRPAELCSEENAEIAAKNENADNTKKTDSNTKSEHGEGF